MSPQPKLPAEAELPQRPVDYLTLYIICCQPQIRQRYPAEDPAPYCWRAAVGLLGRQFADLPPRELRQLLAKLAAKATERAWDWARKENLELPLARPPRFLFLTADEWRAVEYLYRRASM